VKAGDAKPPNYRATTGATSAGPPDSTDGIPCLLFLDVAKRNGEQKQNSAI